MSCVFFGISRSTTPDAELFSTTASGHMRNPAILRRQAEWILSDPQGTHPIRERESQ
ncbi:MAG: DUF1592 domain-containing protein [Rhodopirellula sp.]|nr:DUF1592 domain-containing protein [Rhodopirellula sp.]